MYITSSNDHILEELANVPLLGFLPLTKYQFRSKSYCVNCIRVTGVDVYVYV